MKIGVMSDSHDNVPLIRRAVEALRAEGAECLVHAGDFVAPFAVKVILQFPGPTYGVFGNNDGERAGIRKLWPQVADPPQLLDLGGHRIVVMHDLIPLDKLPADLRSAAVFISGHTHAPVIEKDAAGRLFLNPGETGGWLSGKSTVAVLDTETLDSRIVEL